MAETVIWGDQNDANVFEFFLEKDMITYFDKVSSAHAISIKIALLLVDPGAKMRYLCQHTGAADTQHSL